VDQDTETWEVALTWEPGSRIAVARDVATDELWAVLSVLAEDHWADLETQVLSPAENRALARIMDRLKAVPLPVRRMPGIMVTRSDQTPEALREAWESEFYDIDKAGRRRRRYKRTQLEKDWEAWVKANKAEARLVRADAKTGTQCRECGARWSAGAIAYGLRHECGVGLVKEDQDAGT
jgi:hypothetical protein